jgi:hypothetical protein
MKRFLPTIVMALLLGGLGAYLYFVELPTEQAKEQAETEEKRLLPFEQSAITELTVRSQGTRLVLSPGEGRSWKIRSPIQTDADTREVEGLLRALTLAKVSRVLEDRIPADQPGALSPFGLEQPATVIQMQAGDKRETLSLGDSGPISSTLYAMRDSDRKVVLTDLAAKDVLNKTVLSFRKKEILSFDQAQTDRLRLTYPTTEIVLYRSESNSKAAGAPPPPKKWYLRYPIEAYADQPMVRSLLFKLEDLRALGFVDAGLDRDKLAKRLVRPAVKVTVRANGIDQTMRLFQPDPVSGEAYAVTTPEAPIYKINPTVIKELQRDVFALQDKRLLGLDRDEIGVLSLKTRDAQYSLVNQTGKWMLEDQPEQKLNQETLDLLISRLVSLPAEIRVVKQPGPLAPYGLSSPSLEVRATSLDGKRQGRLILGKKVDGLVYVMGQALSGIFQARSDILTQIPSKTDLTRPPSETNLQ